MKQISAIVATIFILGGCAKQTTDLVTPEQTAEPNLAIEQERMDFEKQADPVLPEQTKDGKQPEKQAMVISEKPGTEGSEAGTTQSRPVSSNTTLSTVTTTAKPAQQQGMAKKTPDENSSADEPAVPLLDYPRQMDYSHEVLFPDSAWDKYMIQRGDFLIKIAKQEYNDWTMWRQIYQWNRKTIGDDPNKIYPYHWLDLLKPYDEVEACKLTFFSRETREGESLWTIAREVYGDEYAWIVLFWDNEELLESSDGVLYPGLRLQIRESIDPCESKS